MYYLTFWEVDQLFSIINPCFAVVKHCKKMSKVKNISANICPAAQHQQTERLLIQSIGQEAMDRSPVHCRHTYLRTIWKDKTNLAVIFLTVGGRTVREPTNAQGEKLQQMPDFEPWTFLL